MTRHRPTLVVIRGNSGSGKTTVARQVRQRYGRGCSLIEQDYLRRIVLREHDIPGISVAAPAVIAATATAALAHGYHVIVEGMMLRHRYATALHQLIAAHDGPSAVFYLDVSLGETIRRHATRTMPGVTAEHLHDWYTPQDLLGVPGEHVIPETSSLEDTVAAIMTLSGLATAQPLAPCPTECSRCKDKHDIAEHDHGPNRAAQAGCYG